MKVFSKRRGDIPALSWIESAAVLPRATLDGRNRALIENHTGIIEYTVEKLRLDSRLGEIVISGRDISLSQVRKSSMIVTGQIDSVSMPEGAGRDG